MSLEKFDTFQSKLTSLSEEQKKIIEYIKKEVKSPLDRKINEEYAKISINTIYRLCGLSKPTIYIVDSPLAGIKKVEALNRYTVSQRDKKIDIREKIETHVMKEEIIVRKQIADIVDENIKELFRENTGHCRRLISLEFLKHIHNRVHDQSFRGTVKTGLSFYMHCEAIKYIPWLYFYLHFKRLGILENELFDAYYQYIQSGIFTNMIFDDFDLVILIKNPLYAKSDNRGRLSNKDGYAIEWSDGYGFHFVNGVYFERELYNSIFVDKTMTGKDILLLRNTEQKAIAIQQYGYYSLIKDIGAKKIGEMEIMTKIGPATNELFEFDIDSNGSWRRIRGRFVKVVDHSTGKITCLGVPIEKNTETVRGAIAWTFRLEEKDYNPVVET